MPLIQLEDVLRSLEIEALGDDRYTAPNVPMEYYRIFGGQLLSQAVVIAARSAEGKQVKSIHALFPKEGDLREPLEWHLSRLQDGRSFAGRSVVASQEGRVIAHATVSLHAPEASGLAHQAAAPEVGPPENAAPHDLSMIPWEARIVAGVELGSAERGPAELRWWMRAPAQDADPVLHQALFAHATDLTLIGTALRPHPFGEADSPERVQTAVTSHTVWFHAPLRVDAWLLLAQESPRVAGGRGFAWGHAYAGPAGAEGGVEAAEPGALVASFAQESLIRVRPEA